MSEQTYSLNGQDFAGNDQNKPTSLQRVEPIEGTPFYLVIQETQYFGTFANYRITEAIELATPLSARTKEEAEELVDELEIEYFKKNILRDIEEQKWTIIMRMVGITHEKLAEEAARYMEKRNGE